MSTDLNLINVTALLKDLTCSICLDYFKEPKTLSCQHSFCSECLEPILKQGIVVCPQCRHETLYRDSNAISKNTILANLVSNLKNSFKVACPQCKIITNLIVCEHCSQVSCKLCKDIHLSDLAKSLEDKCKKLEDIPIKLEKLKRNIINAEKETLQATIERLNKLENEFLSLMQSRKLVLIDQISRFYSTKSKKINKSQETMESMLIELKSVSNKLKELKEKAVKFHLNKAATNRLEKEFNDLEVQISKIESNLISNMPSFDLENNKLDLVCEKFDNFDVYMDMIDKIHLCTSTGDELLLENAKKSDNDFTYEVEVKTAFGFPIAIEVDELKVSYEDFKHKFNVHFGLEKKEDLILFKSNNSKNVDTNCNDDTADDNISSKNDDCIQATRKYMKCKRLLTKNDQNIDKSSNNKMKNDNLFVLFGNMNVNKKDL